MLERFCELEPEQRDVVGGKLLALLPIEDPPQVEAVDELERHIGGALELSEVHHAYDVAVT